METVNVISTYTLGQALEDGYLYKVADLSNGKSYIATVGIHSKLTHPLIMQICRTHLT